jgi:OHCU decarboxylase
MTHDLDRPAFVHRFGGVFEASPWIASEAWERGPYTTVDDLHRAMVAIVEEAPREQRLQLLLAHPDLAGKAAVAGTLTPESTAEQSAAGLDQLTERQHADLLALNATYRSRFGFPFIVCAREHDADSIIATAAERVEAEQLHEERVALAEVAKIARLRLDDLGLSDDA